MKASVVVLDAANIVTLVRGSIRLERLHNAIKHFETLGVRVIAFAPSYWLRSKNLTPRTRSQFQEIDQCEMMQFQLLVDDEKVVLTPPQAHDDLFIIDYAMKHDGYVVTNDMFRDHVANKMEFHGNELTEIWVKTHCITFTFVGSEFLPSAQHIQHLRSICCQHGNECNKVKKNNINDYQKQNIRGGKQGECTSLRINTKISSKPVRQLSDLEDDSDVGVEKRLRSRKSSGTKPTPKAQVPKNSQTPTLNPVAKLNNRYDNLQYDTTSSSASDEEKRSTPESTLMQDWTILQQMIAHHQDQTIQQITSNDEDVEKILSPSQKHKLRRRRQAKKIMIAILGGCSHIGEILTVELTVG
ncbi:hypothetical protein THRCLA_02458 [Thraustotheca clavata]|uniref:RNase NYN domain-containing protein n=1 Tax=Thraustotheca clavata TaxID=74557 RepID=A0A1W0A556_9STRA|nr:hypothetical protein THRCLA_02458 [Thraustotheca clavata]